MQSDEPTACGIEIGEGFHWGRENSASAMEMSAVAAKNVALLLEQYLGSLEEASSGKTCGREGPGGDMAAAETASAAQTAAS